MAADAARAAGVNTIELNGWETNEPGYYWTDETFHHFQYEGDPVGWIWHHTASSRHVPNVKNARGQTKANLWMGLWRDGVLYATGGGTPTVVVASGGPANYSAGAGRKEAWSTLWPKTSGSLARRRIRTHRTTSETGTIAPPRPCIRGTARASTTACGRCN